MSIGAELRVRPWVWVATIRVIGLWAGLYALANHGGPIQLFGYLLTFLAFPEIVLVRGFRSDPIVFGAAAAVVVTIGTFLGALVLRAIRGPR